MCCITWPKLLAWLLVGVSIANLISVNNNTLALSGDEERLRKIANWTENILKDGGFNTTEETVPAGANRRYLLQTAQEILPAELAPEGTSSWTDTQIAVKILAEARKRLVALSTTTPIWTSSFIVVIAALLIVSLYCGKN